MQWLADEAAAFGLTLTAVQLDQFVAYERILLDWNGRINLTAIREPEAIRLRHFLDALTCATVTGSLAGKRLVDVGTGAGFPGVPLKILSPTLELTLVESVAKKAGFLEAVVAELGLSDVTIVNERAETVGQQPAHREKYDWAVARAVAELRTLAEYLLPLCRVGGGMIAQKGESALAEADAAAAALKKLGGGPPDLTGIQLPNREARHYLVTVPKVAPTPARYPRRVGRPGKRPL